MRVTLGNHAEINCDLDGLQAVYERYEVKVIRLKSETTDSVFHRDVFAWTPFGLIKARMGKSSRAWEPDAWFEATGLTPALTLEAPATFEGADLLWLSPSKAVLAIGPRTNKEGAEVVSTWLSKQGSLVGLVVLPSWHDQHLLGIANVVSGSLATIVRPTWLNGVSFDIFGLPSEDYSKKGPNWVSLPNEAKIVNRTCRVTIGRLLSAGYRAEEVGIESLLKYGGGPACATGIVEP